MPSLPTPPFTGSTAINSPGSVGGDAGQLEGKEDGTTGQSGGDYGIQNGMLLYINELYKFLQNLGTPIQTVDAGASDTDYTAQASGPFGLANEVIMRHKERTDTAANWTSNNPILEAGEVGFESDTWFHKTGDGTKTWTSLRYDHGPPWLTAIDGGTPGSTYNGEPAAGYDGVMTFTSADPLIYDSTALTDLDEIYGFGYDGVDTVVILAKDIGNSYTGLFQTDPEFSFLTQLTKASDLPSWNSAFGNNKPAYMTYSSSLGLWVFGSKTGQTWWTTDLSTFNYIPLPTGWSATASKPVGIWWDPGLELFYMTTTGFVRPMLVSATGKTWTDQASIEALGGVHATTLFAPHRIDLGATKMHFYAQWEEYLYKTGDSGGSTGWTKTSNNGVIGGSGGTWALDHVASDGSVIAVCAFGYINISADVTDNPDSWGPNGTSNTGHVDTAWGWPDISGNITAMYHLPQFDRPWIFFNDDHGWWDAATMPSGGVAVPTVTKCTVEPFVSLNVEFDSVDATEPKRNQNYTSISMYYTGYDDEGVWGKKGFGVVVDRYEFGTGPGKDYIVMQRPF